MRLSACLIVRDESGFLPGCLASIQSVVDEIVVVDTGSTDDTVAIAASYGCRVLHHRWRNDFATARNVALDAATGDWILYIDADERVDHAGDLSALDDPEAVAGLVRFTVATGLTPYWEYRLFRNRPDIRFRGAIHETMVPDIRRLVEVGGCTEVRTDLAIVHLGYDGDLDAKHRRNRPILEAAVQATPDRAYLWNELARAQMGLGQLENARDSLASARLVALASGGRPIDALVWCALVNEALGRDASEAAEHLAEGLALYPDNPQLRWMSALLALSRGETTAAREVAAELLEVTPETMVDTCLAFDTRTFRSWPMALIGSSWFADGDYRRAAEWFAAAEQAEPAEPAHRIRRIAAETRAGLQS